MKLSNCIYRFLNQQGDVIYIGKAKDLQRRLKNHNHLPEECYKERVVVEFTIFETESDMDLAERYYIPKYKPKYNQMMAENMITVELSKFDSSKWYQYNSHHELIPDIEEIKTQLQIYKYNNRIQVIKEELESCKDGHRRLFLENDLRRNVEQRLIAVVGRDVFYKLQPAEQRLWIKYNACSREEVLSNLYNKIVKEYVDLYIEHINNKGYFNYSTFLSNLHQSFKINPYFPDKNLWLYWIDEDVKTDNFSAKIVTEINIIEDRIIEALTNIYGEFTKEIILSHEPFSYNSSALIPTALYIYKPKNLR